MPDYAAKRSALLTARAAAMRAEPSPPEALLWAALVSRKLNGVAFRRQVVLAGYICDFVAASHKLIVEVDGAHHARQRAADARRALRPDEVKTHASTGGLHSVSGSH